MDASVVYVEPLITPVAQVDLAAMEEFCRLVFGTKRKVLFGAIALINQKKANGKLHKKYRPGQWKSIT